MWLQLPQLLRSCTNTQHMELCLCCPGDDCHIFLIRLYSVTVRVLKRRVADVIIILMSYCAADSIIMLQYLVGLYVYLFPKVAIRNRRAMAPIHQFFGRATFTAGLATMAVSTMCLARHICMAVFAIMGNHLTESAQTSCHMLYQATSSEWLPCMSISCALALRILESVE